MERLGRDQSLIKGLNIIYDEETRGFIKLRGLALVLTIGAIVVVLGALALIAVLPVVLREVGLGRAGDLAVSIGRWPALVVLVAVALAVFYRLGPDRANPRFRWMSWGALVAVVLWVAVSAGFSWYVSNFGSYGQTYGSLGAVIVLLLWLWLSALAALIGAELDAEIEREAARTRPARRVRPANARPPPTRSGAPTPVAGARGTSATEGVDHVLGCVSGSRLPSSSIREPLAVSISSRTARSPADAPWR